MISSPVLTKIVTNTPFPNEVRAFLNLIISTKSPSKYKPMGLYSDNALCMPQLLSDESFILLEDDESDSYKDQENSFVERDKD